MCGIAGIISRNTDTFDHKAALYEMTRRVSHRGPDGDGHYFFRDVGFGHRRLAILDLTEDGRQPMSYLGERFVITYNGEIYNYIELRNRLMALGYQFYTETDTEVILAAYVEWGEACVQHFNGMWAFAIYNKERHSVFLSRDRFGVKPLYYVNTPQFFAFGSEMRQLLPLLKRNKANLTVAMDFILAGVVNHTTETFFADVKKLSAGDNMLYCLQKHEFTLQSYYRVSLNPCHALLSPEEAVECYMALFEDAVALRLRSDVAVGTCLSGGLDSSSIASVASPLYNSKTGRSFSGITAVSEQESNNEAGYAQQVIEHSDMSWIRVQPSYSDFVDTLPQIVLTQEEPFGSPSIVMQYFVMKAARDHGIPVLLDGQGGDETLLGYDKYYANYLKEALQKEGFRGGIRAWGMMRKQNATMHFLNTLKYLFASYYPHFRFHYYRYQHGYLKNKLTCPSFILEYTRVMSDTFSMQKYELEQTPLPNLLNCEDKNSMAHSIETRLPFLDYRLVELALSFPLHYKIRKGWSKWLLRKGMEHRMPSNVVWRKNKFGFEAPDAIWLKKHFNEMLSVTMASSILQELANPRYFRRHYESLDLRSQWRLYSLALWEKAFL